MRSWQGRGDGRTTSDSGLPWVGDTRCMYGWAGWLGAFQWRYGNGLRRQWLWLANQPAGTRLGWLSGRLGSWLPDAIGCMDEGCSAASKDAAAAPRGWLVVRPAVAHSLTHSLASGIDSWRGVLENWCGVLWRSMGPELPGGAAGCVWHLGSRQGSCWAAAQKREGSFQSSQVSHSSPPSALVPIMAGEAIICMLASIAPSRPMPRSVLGAD